MTELKRRLYTPPEKKRGAGGGGAVRSRDWPTRNMIVSARSTRPYPTLMVCTFMIQRTVTERYTAAQRCAYSYAGRAGAFRRARSPTPCRCPVLVANRDVLAVAAVAAAAAAAAAKARLPLLETEVPPNTWAIASASEVPLRTMVCV